MTRRQIRLPLNGAPNTRVSAITALPTSSAVCGIAVCGISVCGRGAQPTDKDARFVNCFPHTVADALGGGSRRYLVKRSGWQALNTPRTGHVGNAILVWSGQGAGTKVMTAFGNTASSIYDGTTRLTTDAVDTTSITGIATGITETTISGTATLAITSDDNTAWYYQDGGTVTKITDAQFPGNASKTLAGTFANMDGFAFILTTLGELWNPDVNSLTGWTANSYVTAGTYPDMGVAAVRWKAYIIAFGTQSMEFFRNAGNVGSPLVRVQEMAMKIGAVSADAITSIADTIFFCSSTPQGGLSILQWDGQLSRISIPEVDALLQLAGPSSVKMSVMRDFGLSFVIVIAGGITHVYCIEENQWVRWLYGGNEILWTKCAGVSVGSAQVQYAISSLSESGKVFTVNPQARTFQDNGSAFTATAQMQTLDPGHGAFTAYDELEIKGDVESSTSAVTVYISDDDYGTWTSVGTLDMSTNLPKLSALGGTDYPRAHKFEHSANLPMRIEELRLWVDIGT